MSLFQYDFTQRELDLPKEINLAVDGMLRGASLFTDDEGLMLMVLFLYFAERAYFNQLQDTVRPDYTWEEYYYDLQHDVGPVSYTPLTLPTNSLV